jgi:hypothetical protein
VKCATHFLVHGEYIGAVVKLSVETFDQRI